MITETILQNLITFIAPCVAIALIVFCVINGFKLVNGAQGASFTKIAAGVITFFILLGIIYAAGSFETYGKLFQNVTGNVINELGNNADAIVGGGDQHK